MARRKAPSSWSSARTTTRRSERPHRPSTRRSFRAGPSLLREKRIPISPPRGYPRQTGIGLPSRGPCAAPCAFHAAHRERMRLRGDLLTIGIRITHDLRTPVSGIISSTEVVDALGAGSRGWRKVAHAADLRIRQRSREDHQPALAGVQGFGEAGFPPAVQHGGARWPGLGENGDADQGKGGRRFRSRRTGRTSSGDPTYTEAVWVGLLDNAVRHSGNAPRIEVGWEPATDGSKFWVRDQGPGVLPEKQRFLFYPFHRLHEPNAPKGLGLPIVDRLVCLQGGHCGYEPATPRGPDSTSSCRSRRRAVQAFASCKAGTCFIAFCKRWSRRFPGGKGI